MAPQEMSIHNMHSTAKGPVCFKTENSFNSNARLDQSGTAIGEVGITPRLGKHDGHNAVKLTICVLHGNAMGIA